MRQIIQIPALVESTSADDIVTTEIGLSLKDGQIVIEVGEWETFFEVPAEHLNQALAALAPTPTEQPVSLAMVQHLGQKLSRLEQQVAATPHQRLELEALSENLEALRREVLPRLEALENHQITHNAQIAALQGEERENNAAIVALEETAQNFGDRIAVLENNLAEPPAETAALALYGGEQ